MRIVVGMMAALSLAGCASNPTGDAAGAQSPVSQQTAVGDARQRAKAHTELGLHYLRENQLNVALDEARIAIQADSSYPLSYNLLGLVQMYLRENRAAEENFAVALRLAPNDAEINNNYGWFLCQTGKPQQSISYFLAASRNPLYSTPTKPLTNAGICSVSMKNDTDAERYFLEATRADPVNADAQFLLAELYYRVGRMAEAKLRVREVHKLGEPTVESVWLALRIERRLGDRDEEARYAGEMRRKFQGTSQYKLLMQGAFE